jgi:hypothetical protein
MRNLLISLLALTLALTPLAGEAAPCFITCNCRDYHGYGGSRSYGPFNSTAACNAAVSSFTMQCNSGNMGHFFTATCSPGCFSCEPPAAPKANAPQSSTSGPGPQQSAWDQSIKAQQAAEQEQVQKDIEKLKDMIQGVEIGNQNQIRLMPPPTSEALHQLDCARAQSMAGGIETHGKDWTYSSDCTPVRPDVPAVPAPVPADVQGRIPQIQLELQQRISASRQQLAHQDNEIVRLEQIVQTEELKKPEIKKEAPAGESEALRKAREALAKAKADRERTATELAKLEKQETAGPSGAR